MNGCRTHVALTAALLAIVDTGLTRDAAYRIVQRAALAAWDTRTTLREHLASDSESPLDADALDACLTPDRFLRNIGVVFDRLERLSLTQ